jgi:hypothetical protein
VFGRQPQEPSYLCPGQRQPVSLAVHLGRLARFDRECLRCPRRDETHSLTARQVQRLHEVIAAQDREPSVNEGALLGQANELSPSRVRQLGIALGLWLRSQSPGQSEPAPTVVIGHNAEPAAPERIAALGEGLRWAACRVVDLGAVTAPCLSFAVGRVSAAGGVYVGSADGQGKRGLSPLPEPPYGRQLCQASAPSQPSVIEGDCPLFPGASVAIRLWDHAGVPLSKIAVDELQSLASRGGDRPARRFGPIEYYPAEADYLAPIGPLFFGLRPLRLVVAAPRPWLACLRRLAAETACAIYECRPWPERVAERIAAEQAHFGAIIQADCLRWRLWDEQGREAAVPRCDDAPADALIGVARLMQALSRSDAALSAVLDAAATAG